MKDFRVPPAAKMERLILLIRFLQDKPRTTNEIAREISITRRSVYRYIDLLEATGFEIKRVSLNKGYSYRLDFSPFCPTCGKIKKKT